MTGDAHFLTHDQSFDDDDFLLDDRHDERVAVPVRRGHLVDLTVVDDHGRLRRTRG